MFACRKLDLESILALAYKALMLYGNEVSLEYNYLFLMFCSFFFPRYLLTLGCFGQAIVFFSSFSYQWNLYF